jgi:hypothetical protein
MFDAKYPENDSSRSGGTISSIELDVEKSYSPEILNNHQARFPLELVKED